MSLLMKSITAANRTKKAKKAVKRKPKLTADGFPTSAPNGYGITIWRNEGRQGSAVNVTFKDRKTAQRAASALRPGLDRGGKAVVEKNIFVKKKPAWVKKS